jgi:hypothetical protein
MQRKDCWQASAMHTQREVEYICIVGNAQNALQNSSRSAGLTTGHFVNHDFQVGGFQYPR